MAEIMTKDGVQIRVGDWISDSDGVYEVTEIGSTVYLREVYLGEDDSVNYEYGEARRLLPSEIAHMQYA